MSVLLHIRAGVADWHDWSLEPAVVLPLALSAALYLIGARRLHRVTTTSNGGRRSKRSSGWERRRRQHILFASGWLTLALSLISPLHFRSEQLFSAHMIQHELMMTLAVPLLVWSRPAAIYLWAVPERFRRRIGGVLSGKVTRALREIFGAAATAWIVYALTLWVWHVPALFQATLRDDRIHALQHASFLGAAFCFWNSLGRASIRHYGAGLLSLFTTAVHTSILGALIAFDSHIWYPAYIRPAAALGVSPLADQQWAGLIMWVPGSVPYLVAALLLMAEWLRQSGRRSWVTP